MNCKKWANLIKKVKNKEQARQIAIEFQQWVSDRDISYGEIVFYQSQLGNIAKKYGLIREFKENCVI